MNILKYELCCCGHCSYVAAFFYIIKPMDKISLSVGLAKLNIKKKTVSILFCQINEKVPLKWPWKTLKNILLKSMKKI